MKSSRFVLLLLVITGCVSSKKTTEITLNFLEKNSTSKLYYAYDKEGFQEVNFIKKDHENRYKVKIDLGKAKQAKYEKLFFAWSLNADTTCVHKIYLGGLMKLKRKFPQLKELNTDYKEGCDDGVLVSQEKMKFVGNYRLKLKDQEYELELISFMGEFWGNSKKYDKNYLNSIAGNWDYNKDEQTFTITVDRITNPDIGLTLKLSKEKAYKFKVGKSNGKFIFKADNYSLVKL